MLRTLQTELSTNLNYVQSLFHSSYFYQHNYRRSTCEVEITYQAANVQRTYSQSGNKLVPKSYSLRSIQNYPALCMYS